VWCSCRVVEGCGSRPIQYAGEDDDHNRRANLIERQRDPQRERSGHHRATANKADLQLSSLLLVRTGNRAAADRLTVVMRFPRIGELRDATVSRCVFCFALARGVAWCLSSQ
jgi:hypothetical protein